MEPAMTFRCLLLAYTLMVLGPLVLLFLFHCLHVSIAWWRGGPQVAEPRPTLYIYPSNAREPSNGQDADGS